jgi:hypothetical protein
MGLWNVRILWPNGTSNSRPVIAATADEAQAIYAREHGIKEKDEASMMTVTPAVDPDGRTEAMLLEGYSRARWTR